MKKAWQTEGCKARLADRKDQSKSDRQKGAKQAWQIERGKANLADKKGQSKLGR